MSSRYIEQYKIIEKLNPIAYRLDLSVELEHVYNVFHISQLRKYVLDPDNTIATKPIEVPKDLVYEKHPVQILNRRIK